MTHATNAAPVSPRDAGVVASAHRAVDAGFPRAARVRAKAEFARVFESGKRTAEPRLALHWLPDDAPPRLGLAVSRKVDPRAVGRNRIKRILRDAFRHHRAGLRGGAYVIVARSAAAQADGVALRRAFDALLQRAGALPLRAPAGTMPPATSPSIQEAAQ
ncbi:MAG: ribonuclease P protein component [Thermomonas sp.]|uniref:ribonuclease P protein component n=1 Tax=Thermomonas sp. TaxID=1971895 RepID=UPI0039E48EC9